MKGLISIYTNKKNLIYYSLFLSFSLIIMLFFSMSSPLYLTNPWEDSNFFLTIGRGILANKVPYKDLFDQKGPLLYFIHSLGALLALKKYNFFGIYLIESLSLSISMILLYKSLSFYYNQFFSFILSVFLPFFLICEPFFKQGDSAEELCFPFFFGLIYLIAKLDYSNFVIDSKYLFINGILLACVFWIKFTLIAPWIGFYLFFLIYFIGTNQIKKIFDLVIFGFLGFLTVTLPILIYFLFKKAIADLFFNYFYVNLFLYSSSNEIIRNPFEFIVYCVKSYNGNISFIFIFFTLFIILFSKTLFLTADYKFNSNTW